MREHQQDPETLCETALESAGDAIASGDAAGAERWLKVARQAAAVAADVTKTRTGEVAMSPAEKLANARRERAKVVAVLTRRLARLAAMPDEEPEL